MFFPAFLDSYGNAAATRPSMSIPSVLPVSRNWFPLSGTRKAWRRRHPALLDGCSYNLAGLDRRRYPGVSSGEPGIRGNT